MPCPRQHNIKSRTTFQRDIPSSPSPSTPRSPSPTQSISIASTSVDQRLTAQQQRTVFTSTQHSLRRRLRRDRERERDHTDTIHQEEEDNDDDDNEEDLLQDDSVPPNSSYTSITSTPTTSLLNVSSPPSQPPTMFSNRKYSALPTTASDRSPSMNKRRGGGVGQWKRYCIIIAVGLLALLFLAGGRAGRKYLSSDTLTQEEYGVSPAGQGETFEYDDYQSPPFLPDGSDLNHAITGSDGEIDEDAEGALHILPFPIPSSNKGQNDDDLPDFTEIDAEEQDDFPPTSSSKTNVDEEEEEEESAEDTDEDTNEDTDEKPSNIGPTSFDTDPNPESTTHCETPYSAEKPIVQYALTIDAGSTGSRIHVYKFHNCGPAPTLEYETFKAIQPGLSSFARDPTAAAASLDPLMEEALRVVPESLHKCSPVEVKATAGLRLLPGREGQAILDEVRQRLEVDWPFSLSKEDSAVEIMDGKDEGVYAWITANYLLGKIGAGTEASTTDTTMAVMDLGGASTQIVFEPQFASTQAQLAEGDHKYALSFGGRDFVLYQHSYLGYGLMRARRSVHNLVAFTWSFLQPNGGTDIDWDALDEDVEVPNPCLASGERKRVELDPPGRKAVNVTMVGVDGGFGSCNRVVELVMAKDAICEVKPCSFNGVYQPSLLDTFPHGQLLALSYFTDRIQPLLAPYIRKNAAASTLTIGTLSDMAKAVCAGPTVWQKKWRGDAKALAELEGRPEYCLDLTFMHALLGLGYELGEDRQLVVEKKLRGVELGWALGAGIAMLEKATLTCTL